MTPKVSRHYPSFTYRKPSVSVSVAGRRSIGSHAIRQYPASRYGTNSLAIKPGDDAVVDQELQFVPCVARKLPPTDYSAGAVLDSPRGNWFLWTASKTRTIQDMLRGAALDIPDYLRMA